MNEDLFSESLGLGEFCNPRKARVDWLAVQELVLQNPELAKVQCGRRGVFYALNLAICNCAYLAPATLIEHLIHLNPDALTGDSFDFACGNHHLSSLNGCHGSYSSSQDKVAHKLEFTSNFVPSKQKSCRLYH